MDLCGPYMSTWGHWGHLRRDKPVVPAKIAQMVQLILAM